MYLKRIAVPKTWPVERKLTKLITAPLPRVSRELGMPLNVVLKELLNVAATSREVKVALKTKRVTVDGKVREPKFAVGLMDVLSLNDTHYRMMLNKKGKLELISISKDEAGMKPCRIVGKTVLKGGVMQYNLHDSGNFTGGKDFKVGDTLVLSLPARTLLHHISFEKKSFVYLTGGAHIGEGCVVENIKGNKLLCKAGDTLLETLTRFAFAVGKDKPAITLPG